MSLALQELLELHLPIPIPEELPAYNVEELERMANLLGLPPVSGGNPPMQRERRSKQALIEEILSKYGRRLPSPEGGPLRYVRPPDINIIGRMLRLPPEVTTLPELSRYLEGRPNFREEIFDLLRPIAERDTYSEFDRPAGINLLLGVFNQPSELTNVRHILHAASISTFAIGEPATIKYRLRPNINVAAETLAMLKTLLPVRLMTDTEILDIWRGGTIAPNYRLWRERQIRLRNYLSIDPTLLEYLMYKVQQESLNVLDLVHSPPAPFEKALFQTRLWPLEQVAQAIGFTARAGKYNLAGFVDHLLQQARSSVWRSPSPSQQNLDIENSFRTKRGLHLLGLGNLATMSDAMLRSIGRDMNLPVDLAADRQELLDGVRAESGRGELYLHQQLTKQRQTIFRNLEKTMPRLLAPPISCGPGMEGEDWACPDLRAELRPSIQNALSILKPLSFRKGFDLYRFHNLDPTLLSEADVDFIGAHGYPPPNFEQWDRLLMRHISMDYALIEGGRGSPPSLEQEKFDDAVHYVATRPITEVALALGMRVPPNQLPKFYFRRFIQSYETVYTRWARNDPTTLEEAHRGLRYREYLQQLSDFEIEALFQVRVSYSSRQELISNMVLLLQGKQQFFLPLTKKCSNAETTLLNDTSSTQVIAYGTLDSYICYEPEELYASFTRIPGTGDLLLLHPEAPIPFTKWELDQLLSLIEQELPELIDLREVLENSLPFIVEDPEKILKANFDSLSAQDREIIKGLLYALFETGMYMRRWRGPGKPFPYTDLETRCKLNPEPATQEGLAKIQARLDSLSRSGQIFILNLPLVRENRGVLQQRGPLRELYEELRRGEYCIRMASIWFVTSGYHYLKLLFNETIPDFNLERLVDIS